MSLLPLRPEIALSPGPAESTGGPSWTLYDPIARRYFRVGRLEFEMLTRWGLGDPERIAQAVGQDTVLRPDAEAVGRFAAALAGAGLLQMRGEAGLAWMLRAQAAARPGLFWWLIKNYLFVRIPLLRPEALLRATAPWLGWAFRPGFYQVTAGIGLIGAYLSWRQWDAFSHSFAGFLSLEGLAWTGLTLTLVKILHEFGHAHAAHRFGCRVPTMGVALLVMWPVLYTDATDAWRLASRRQRLLIDGAGMIVELCLASYALLAWSLMANGPARSAAFLIATTSWVTTLAVNLNPLMRFDGYYLLSDFLDVPNLQTAGFALGRWWLREALFGLGAAPPEALAPRQRRLLILYALGSWIYRFFLFLGIAILVYHFFFKALGMVLFAIEIGYFLVAPILAELGHWLRQRDRIGLNRHSLASGLGLLGLVALLVIPWQSSIRAPAVLQARQEATLYAPPAGRLETLAASPGQDVAAGQVLAIFTSEDLDHALAQSERRIASLNWEIANQAMDESLRDRGAIATEELQAALAEHQGFELDRAHLTITAPFAGRLVGLSPSLQPGQYAAKDEAIGLIISREPAEVEAYLTDADLGRLAPGATGLFYAEDAGLAPIPVRLIGLDQTGTHSLARPYVATKYGGSLATRDGPHGTLVPEDSVYRMLLAPITPQPAPAMVLRGAVRLDGAAESALARFWRRAVSIIIRESGW